jgi:adenine phosphoribosyltransferase
MLEEQAMSQSSTLEPLIRAVPDFPTSGVLFRDITPLLADGAALRRAIGEMCAPWRDAAVETVVGIEARGFIFAGAMACELGAGFVPVRKPGKLPWRTRRIAYSLEYGSDALEVHDDAFREGQRVVVVDDVLATGGTARAVVDLVRQQGAQVVGVTCLINLKGLDGRRQIAEHRFHSLIEFD